MKKEIKTLLDLTYNEKKELRGLVVKESSLIRYLNEAEDYPSEKTNKNIILLKQNESIVAWALLGYDDDFGDGKTDGMIHVFVDKSYRNLGIAKELFLEALNELKSIGIFDFFVYAHDKQSLSFYNKILSLYKNEKMTIIN